jgi:predicted site-specific integrase-resolvase
MLNMKTLQVVAQELGVKEITLVNEHKKGRLPLTVVGHQRFVAESDLETWMKSKRVEKPAKRKLSPEHADKIRAAFAARKAAKNA